MARLLFDGAGVAALIAETLNHPTHYMTMDQRLQAWATRTGKSPEIGRMRSEDFDDATAPTPGEERDAAAGLWLVKDQGIYLLSNAVGRQAPPVYAVGYGPDADWDHVREAAGGDDFVEYLPIDMPSLRAIDATQELVIDLTPTQMRWEVRARPKSSRKRTAH